MVWSGRSCNHGRMKASISGLEKHDIRSIEIDGSVKSAYEMMRAHKIRHLVVTNDDECVGIISDRDIQRAIRTDITQYEGRKIIEFAIDPSFVVRDFMGWPVKSVESTLSVREVNRRMLRDKISAFLVTEGDHVTGIVTHEDLMLYLDSLLAEKEGAPHFFEKLKFLGSKNSIGALVSELANSGI